MFRDMFKQKRFIGLLVYILFISSFSLMIPVVLKVIIDYILVERLESIFYIVMSSLVILTLLKFFFNLLQDLYFLSFRQRYEKSLILPFFTKGFGNNLSEHVGDGDYISKITSFVNSFQFNLVTVIYYLFYSIAVSVISLIILYTQSLPLFIITSIFLFLHWVNYVLHYNANNNEGDLFFSRLSDINDFLLSFSRYFPSVKIYSLEKEFEIEFCSLNEDLYSSGYSRDMISSSQELIQDFLLYSSYGVVVVFLSNDIMNGDCSLGTLMMILMILQFCFEPIYRLASVTKQASEMKVKLNRLNNRKFKDNASHDLCRIETKISRIQVSRLSYNVGGIKIIEGIDYTFYEGNIYIIKGASGEGKSTFLKLISGILSDFNGDINFYDDAGNIVSRPLLGYMDQNNVPFRTTLEKNTSMFSDNIDSNRLKWSHSIAGVSGLKSLYKNQTSEQIDPVKLSGGEKARLAISQSFYSNSNVIILDEPTGSLDSQSQKEFFENIVKIKDERIVIIVSHRDESFEYADHLLTIQSGKILTQTKVCDYETNY